MHVLLDLWLWFPDLPLARQSGMTISWRFPDAVQRETLIRDRRKLGVSEDPGSAAQHSVSLRAAPRPGHA
jgi:hypothetical protein